MTDAEKAAAYDKLIKDIRNREPAIHKVLARTSSGYRHAPVEALLEAFDRLANPGVRARA